MTSSSNLPPNYREAGKFEIDALHNSAESPAPLPEGYGDNRLVLMARDPFWFFAYWEITHDRAEQIRTAHGSDAWDRSVMVLRVYDLGESQETPMDAAAFFDVQVDKFSRQWYVQVPVSGHTYLGDLGLKWPDGKFVSLFRSNVIRQPFGRISEQLADSHNGHWMSVNLVTEQQAWEKMALMAIGAAGSKGVSGGEESNAQSLRWEFFKSVFSGSVSHWPGSMPSSMPGSGKKS